MTLDDHILAYLDRLGKFVSGTPLELFASLGLPATFQARDFLPRTYVNQTVTHLKEPARSPESIPDLLAHYTHIALIGGAGTGKSTALRFIASHLCNAFADQSAGHATGQRQIPALVHLSSLSDTSFGAAGVKVSLTELLRHSVVGALAPALVVELEHRFANGTVCLLLDGLDELTDALRTHLVELLTQLARTPGAPIVITSRAPAYPTELLSMFVAVTLNEFTPDDIDDYLLKWYRHVGAHPLASGSSYAWSLRSRMGKSGLLEMASTPLLLAQLAIFHTSSEHLDATDSEVLKALLELLLFRWRSGPHVSYLRFAELRQQGLLNDEEIVRLLGYVAFRHMSYGPPTKPIVSQWIREYLSRVRVQGEEAGDIILSFFLECSPILTVQASGVCSFSSRRVQEWLVAFYLQHATEQDSYTEVLPALAQGEPERWGRVVLLVGDMLPENAAVTFADSLSRQQLAPGAKGSRSLSILCGKLVRAQLQAGRGFGIYGKTVAALRKAMLDIVNDPRADWLEARDAGNVLGALGDERSSVDALLQPNHWHEVPAGAFEMGRGLDKHAVQVPRFWISKYLVTNQQFQKFAAETAFERFPEHWLRDAPGILRPNYPVLGVHWTEAIAFTRWINNEARTTLSTLAGPVGVELEIRLPTEAEWEKAACAVVNISSLKLPFDPLSVPDEGHDQFEVCPVGLMCLHDVNADVFDVFDNVWEWTISAYRSYPYIPNDGRNDVSRNEPKAVRGGYGYIGDIEHLRTHRGQCHLYRPVYKLTNVGIRLVVAEVGV